MKNQLIINGSYQKFVEQKKNIYLSNEDCNDFSNYYDFTEEELNELQRIYNNNRERKKLSFDYICKMMFEKTYFYEDSFLVFGTLTFTDKVLKSTSKQTRRRYVQRFLNDTCFHYQANIDYGSKKGREHYHFIGLVFKPIEQSSWKYGSISFERIKDCSKDLKRTKNYLNKLNNHSYKESTKLERIIRDRNNDDYAMKLIEIFEDEKYKNFKKRILVSE